jgi:hypothetical protein
MSGPTDHWRVTDDSSFQKDINPPWALKPAKQILKHKYVDTVQEEQANALNYRS